MNDQFRNFFEALKATDIGTKIVIGMSSVAMIAALAVVGMVSSDSHYEVVWTDLTETEAGRVSVALAGRNIDFRQQYANSKVTIVVNSTEVQAANQAAAESGAIIGKEKGILAASSSGGVFDGAGERNQKLMAARWSQTELMLESLSFVDGANLQTTLQTGSSLRSTGPTSAAVILSTAGGIALTKEEGQRIANTVINTLGIDPDRLTIMDTQGRSVYSPGDESGEADSRGLDYQRNYDRIAEADVNATLAILYGPNKVNVTVHSLFDFKQETLSKHEFLKPVKNSERKLTTETPIGGSGQSGAGGLAGTASNTPNGEDDWGQDGATLSGGSGAVQTSTTEESESTSNVGYSDTIVVKTQPVLMSLSIGVAFDESLAADGAKIDALVKRMVGFIDDGTRKDQYNSEAIAFYKPEVPEEGVEETFTLPQSNGMSTGFLIEKGVEIVSALAFIFLLLKGFKSAKGSGKEVMSPSGVVTKVTADGKVVPDIEIAPEQLARAQVEDMVKNNPERVAQILSNWVIEDRNTVNS